MAKEVIQVIQDIETQITNRQQETRKAIEQINTTYQHEVSQLHQLLEEKLAAHRSTRENEMQETLALDKAYYDNEVEKKSQALKAIYNEKQKEMTKRILEEVLNQYGYRQDEKADTVS